jgi:mono/diheme cytochrome c family protein
MFCYWQKQIVLWFVVTFFLPIEGVARPSKEEKARRRSAFWGVFSDTYRASGCLGFKPVDLACAKTALNDALVHADVIEISVTDKDLGFSKRLKLIQGKVDSADVQQAQSEMKGFLRSLFVEFAEASAPVVQPDKTLGQKVYKDYCASCHGDKTSGQGKLAGKLKRIPPSFNRSDRSSTQFPFGIYAVMIHGTDDGEMTSLLDVLTVDELWSVAFYVASFRFNDHKSFGDSAERDKLLAQGDTFALSALAMATDEDLEAVLQSRGICTDCQSALYSLRSEFPWQVSTSRLDPEVKAPRDQTEDRALVILLIMVILVSAGFIYILKRTGRVDDR